MRHRLAVILPVYIALYALGISSSYFVRFEFEPSAERLQMMFAVLPIALAFKLVSAIAWREFSRSFRHTTVDDLVTVGISTATAAALLWGANSLFESRSGMLLVPRSVICIDAVFSFLLISTCRSIQRLSAEVIKPLWGTNGRQPTLIFGVNQPSVAILKMLKATNSIAKEYRAVGFVTNDQQDHRARIGGLEVVHIAGDDHWARLFEQRQIKNLLIPGETPGRIVRKLFHECSRAGVKVNVIPTVDDLVDGRFKLGVRDLTISDLLRREPNELDLDAIRDYVSGQRVLVTGGAGSIGSELCRQIAALKPEMLIVFDQSEFGTFSVEREFAAKDVADIDVRYVVADVLDETMLHQAMREFQPQLVFHAAAYKHVPLMENNPQAAVLNNIAGTKAVADAASEHGVERFVLISTDKAVRPTSVMGASKLMAEKYIQSLSQQSRTRFITVRFGNVLNSMGSVVPTFRRQIELGGPITVTHPEMNRFFMTIPEAVQLVLQAGAIGGSGEVLILDMGEPVKIVDLAKDMIMLSGLKYPDDIDIVFTGMRPGEKLYEELFYARESGAKKVHEKIYRGDADPLPLPQVIADIQHLHEAAQQGREMTLKAFRDIVGRHTDHEWVPSGLAKAA